MTCSTMKPMVPTNSLKAVEVTQELLRSAHIPVHTAASSVVPATSAVDTTESMTEFDKAKTRIMKVETIKTITVRRPEESLSKIKQRHP